MTKLLLEARPLTARTWIPLHPIRDTRPGILAAKGVQILPALTANADPFGWRDTLQRASCFQGKLGESVSHEDKETINGQFRKTSGD